MKLRLMARKSSSVQAIDEASTALAAIEKFGERLTPNMRALRFTMTACDLLLSMGLPANTVASKALDITEAYCKRPVHIDISANVLMLSQLRGVDKEPLTLFRPVALRSVNNMVIQSVENLIHKISQGQISLSQAEKELEDILKKPKSYPWWLVMFGQAGIVAGVTLVFTQSWRIILTTFTIGLLVNRLLAYLTKRTIPQFFKQIIAASTITLTAAFIALLARSGVEFFSGINPTLIVVAGIIMLVAGLAIVSAMQDAIEEFYVTANARLIRVGMLTIGIVIGILIGLYTSRKLGFGIAVSPDPLHPSSFQFQIIGSTVAAASYALATQTYVAAIAWAGMTGGSALAISYAARQLDISVIPASGVAAIFVGLVAALLSRLWRTPSSGIIMAGILPLVPGLALYNGLMQLINYPPGDPLFSRGLGTLFTALATALAIAAGATFGSMVGRPLHHKLAYRQSQLPFFDFFRRQLNQETLKREVLERHRRRLPGATNK